MQSGTVAGWKLIYYSTGLRNHPKCLPSRTNLLRAPPPQSRGARRQDEIQHVDPFYRPPFLARQAGSSPDCGDREPHLRYADGA